MKYFLIITLWRYLGPVIKPNFTLSSKCSAGNRGETQFCRSICQPRGASLQILHHLTCPPQLPTTGPSPPSAALPQPWHALHSSLDHTTHLWLCSGSSTFSDAFSHLSQTKPYLSFKSDGPHLTEPLYTPSPLPYFLSIVVTNIPCCCFCFLTCCLSFSSKTDAPQGLGLLACTTALFLRPEECLVLIHSWRMNGWQVISTGDSLPNTLGKN